MLYFIVGFIAGAYTSQNYNVPDVSYLLDLIKEEEKKRRK